jgi:hypothetical protein
VRHPIDIAIMFAALWLLGSMVLDYLTPKELTVYMIAAATAPAVIGTGLSYYLRFPRIDFVLILTTLGADDGMDLAGAVAGFPDRRGIGAGVDRRRHPALASLPLAPALRWIVWAHSARVGRWLSILLGMMYAPRREGTVRAGSQPSIAAAVFSFTKWHMRIRP